MMGLALTQGLAGVGGSWLLTLQPHALSYISGLLNGSGTERLSLLLSIVIILFSLSFHEFSHGYAAYRLGDHTAYDQGRLTLNPLAHLDPIGALMMLSGLIGWAKPVPFNPSRFRPEISMKKGIVIVAAAGPLSNLFLSFIGNIVMNIVILLPLLFGRIEWSQSQVYMILLLLCHQFTVINIYLAVFNSLPVPPLDGFKVFGAFLPNQTYYGLMRYERTIGLAFLFILIFIPGVVSKVLNIVAIPFEFILHRPIDWLFHQLAMALVGRL